ncbi:G2/M phase-specific E3 ubiquitin-protein ligase-like [Xenia sp. Carnegie-2017]|uniref:G2/M phase-specific E3 ubiquitin-protein ligase-like n=1 Tax=Xenia sp. Carnegie-2017 TaxID=2897299 RepID=UPI001F04ACA0|nr:G2/M phase-specific E3 ubiquitin-protein ligase-like [Xenia sp. Carnegie-2017]
MANCAYFRRKGFLSSAGILKVSFATFEEEEDAVDQGVPRREFFHLLLGAIARDSGIMCSMPTGCVIRCNVGALNQGTFLAVGHMLATLVVQGGELPRIFSKSVCQYIEAGFGSCTPDIDELPDKNIRDSLLKLKAAKDQGGVDSFLAESEWRYDIDGLSQTLLIKDKLMFIEEVTKYFIIIKCKPMLDQLIEGLNYYDVLQLVRANKGMANYLFQYNPEEKMDGSKLIKIMKPNFSPIGHHRREPQEIIMAKFIAFIKSMEDGSLLGNLHDEGIELTEEERFASEATPKHILLFATGATNVPTIGFVPKPTITFVHDDGKMIPSAQTCSNSLHLYVNKKTLDCSLAHCLLTALMNGGIFSKL